VRQSLQGNAIDQNNKTDTGLDAVIKIKVLCHHQLRTILQRLCQMYSLDILTSCQIRNCARQLEHMMVAAY
jgi:hypothetical protein